MLDRCPDRECSCVVPVQARLIGRLLVNHSALSSASHRSLARTRLAGPACEVVAGGHQGVGVVGGEDLLADGKQRGEPRPHLPSLYSQSLLCLRGDGLA